GRGQHHGNGTVRGAAEIRRCVVLVQIQQVRRGVRARHQSHERISTVLPRVAGPARAFELLRAHVHGRRARALVMDGEAGMRVSKTSLPETGAGFHRSIGLFSATAINMTQMCGIGPFITIPLMVAAMGGPQAVVGWVAGAILAVADGMVWAELGAAMPGSGGSYVYLREAFQYRTGKLMPFLFIWTVLLATPLTMSTGIIGMVDYLQFFFPPLSWTAAHLISLA